MTIKEAVEKYNEYMAAVNKYTSLFDKIDSSMNRARVSGTDSIDITFENWEDIRFAISLAISHYNHRLKETFDDKALDNADSAVRDLSCLISCLPTINEVERASSDLHVITQYIKFLRDEDEPQKEEKE